MVSGQDLEFDLFSSGVDWIDGSGTEAHRLQMNSQGEALPGLEAASEVAGVDEVLQVASQLLSSRTRLKMWWKAYLWRAWLVNWTPLSVRVDGIGTAAIGLRRNWAATILPALEFGIGYRSAVCVTNVALDRLISKTTISFGSIAPSTTKPSKSGWTRCLERSKTVGSTWG